VYAYRIHDAEKFYKQLSGTLPVYTTADLDGYLRDTLMGKVSDTFAESNTPFLDMAANLNELSKAAMAQVSPVFDDLGLELHAFQVQNLSLPDELQKKLDERIGMNMVGNLRDYTQYQMAQAIPIAAANEGGGAGLGASLGAGMAMGKAMTDAMSGGGAATPPSAPQPAQVSQASAGGAAPSGDPHSTKFCMDCGKPIARAAKFCPECGGTQG
jgi:membrane protease subunit (stomatin/prohibitin family)